MTITNLVIHYKETAELEENLDLNGGAIFRITLKEFWSSFLVVVFATVVSKSTSNLTLFFLLVWHICDLPVGISHLPDLVKLDHAGEVKAHL